MARNVERKLIRGVLKVPNASRRGNNFQKGYLKESFHYNSGTYLGNPLFQVALNNNPVGRLDKIGDSKRGSRGMMRGIWNRFY